jgi:hypothetical protein
MPFSLPRQIVIVVLGARSGTSALAGTLGLLGGALPENLMAANWANTKGYFEPEDIAALHDEILASVGSIWHDWRPFPLSWFSSPEAASYRLKLAALFTKNYGDATCAVLKEPRMCRMLPLWDGVFEELGVRPVFCFIDRNPLEIAASLRARDGSSKTQGLLYYIRNHLDSETATRGRCRLFISYDRLLADWRETVAAIERFGLSFMGTDELRAKVDAFLEVGMRHQRADTLKRPADPLSHMAYSIHDTFTQLSVGGSEREARARLNQLRADFDIWERENSNHLE